MSTSSGPETVTLHGTKAKNKGNWSIVVANAARAAGNYSDSEACWSIPPGSLTYATAQWALSSGTYNASFTLGTPLLFPSSSLIKSLVNAHGFRHSPTNAAQSFPIILAAAQADGLTIPQTAYVLATADAESSDQYNIVEAGQTVQQFDNNYAYIDGNGGPSTGDGYTYRGRGFIQTTGKGNYSRMATLYGGPYDVTAAMLVANPDLLIEPAYEDFNVAILINGMMNGSFTGAALPTYINAQTQDYVDARRVVNSLDSAYDIAATARNYAQLLAGGC